MGFLLWLKDGVAEEIEGFSYGEDTSWIDFASPSFVLAMLRDDPNNPQSRG